MKEAEIDATLFNFMIQKSSSNNFKYLIKLNEKEEEKKTLLCFILVYVFVCIKRSQKST